MPSPFRLPNFLAWSLIFLFLLCPPATRAEQVKNLKPQGYVSDFAGVLSTQSKDKLTALCAEVDQKTNAQIAVVTASSLEGEPIEQFSIDLATSWGIGPKQKDRGVLILLAPNDRKYRIEVGYELEPILPDGKVGGFGREAVPLLRSNDYSGAALLMTERVAQVIAANRNIILDSLSGVPAPQPESENPPAQLQGPLWILVILFFIFFPVLGFLLRVFVGFGGPNRYRRGGGMWTGGPRYGGGTWGGGGSWGGGGGGGFGGFGGGSFGGGGASGNW